MSVFLSPHNATLLKRSRLGDASSLTSSVDALGHPDTMAQMTPSPFMAHRHMDPHSLLNTTGTCKPLGCIPLAQHRDEDQWPPPQTYGVPLPIQQDFDIDNHATGHSGLESISYMAQTRQTPFVGHQPIYPRSRLNLVDSYGPINSIVPTQHCDNDQLPPLVQTKAYDTNFPPQRGSGITSHATQYSGGGPSSYMAQRLHGPLLAREGICSHNPLNAENTYGPLSCISPAQHHGNDQQPSPQTDGYSAPSSLEQDWGIMDHTIGCSGGGPGPCTVSPPPWRLMPSQIMI